jgi:osmotically-inducible protein OsmY
MKRKFIACIGISLLLASGLPLVGCADTRTTESTGHYIDDTAITTKVKAKLLADPATSAIQISVETYKGVVQLSGFVDSNVERDKAAEIARGVGEVKDVRNDLVVKTRSS